MDKGQLIVDELVFFFFFQAEDGIRDGRVTGVQTCALPISSRTASVEVSSVLVSPLCRRHATSPLHEPPSRSACSRARTASESTCTSRNRCPVNSSWV